MSAAGQLVRWCELLRNDDSSTDELVHLRKFMVRADGLFFRRRSTAILPITLIASWFNSITSIA